MTYASAQSRTACTSPRAAEGFLTRLASSLGTWRQRRALRRLDAAALQDIGISRQQALAEADRGFWDAPDHWRC